MIRGIGTSKGIGIGHALIIDEPQIEAKTEIVSDTAAELRRYENVKKKFIADTQNIIEELKKKLKENDKTSLVLQNQIYLIEDIEMNQQITGFIENEHLCADAAVDRTCSLYADIFASLDSEVMNQRVADIEDLKHRILSMLSGNVTVDLSNLEPDTIIVAKQLHPSVTAAMDTKHVVGIIAEKGGETSHAAILAPDHGQHRRRHLRQVRGLHERRELDEALRRGRLRRHPAGRRSLHERKVQRLLLRHLPR